MSIRVKSFRVAMFPLLFALTANAAAQSFLLVVFPALGRDMGFSPIHTGMLLGLAALLALVAAPFWGKVSETRGRRFVLKIGFASAFVGFALIAIIVRLRLDDVLGPELALALLLLVRAVQSLLTGGLLPGAQALMADRTSSDQRAEGMGLLGAAYGSGGIIGAGVAYLAGGVAPALAMLGLAFALAVGFAVICLQPNDGPRWNKPAQGVLPSSLALRPLCPTLIVTLLGVTVYGIMQHVTSLRLEDSFGLSRTDAISRAGSTLMVVSIAMVLVQTFGLRLLKIDPANLRLGGAFIATLALVGVSTATGVASLTVALLALGAALGLLLPGNLACLSLIAGPHAQGRAAGINAVAQGLGMALGPIAGAALHQFSPAAAPIAGGLAMVLVFLTVLPARKRALP